MSSMAKIFVVVNLVLCVAVFGSAATGLGAQDDYRTALDDATEKAMATHTSQQAQIDNWRLKASTQQSEASRQLARADDAEQRLLLANKELEAARQANAGMVATNERLTGELSGLTKQIEGQQATVSAAQSEAKDANQKYQDAKKQWEEEVRNRSALEGRVQELDEAVRTLQAQNNDGAKKISDLEFWLSEAEKQGFKRGGSAGNAEGVVLKVQDVAGGGMVVIISVGTDAGVKVGQTYQLSRGNQYVGSIKITRVQKSSAVGEFDTQFKGSGAPPQENDRAYVR